MSAQYTPEMAIGVYIIENLFSGACYIGCTAKSFNQRWYLHRQQLRLGRHNIKALQSDWDRLGSDAFSFRILEQVDDPDDLGERELVWLLHLAPAYNTRFR